MIDAHSHLHHRRFDDDRDEVLRRTISAGITHLIQIGCSLEDSRRAIALVDPLPGAYATVGIHPHDADSLQDGVLDAMAGLARNPNVVAYGEIGLDYYYDNSPRDVQRQAFIHQLILAGELALPVVIHTRDAEEDTLAILKDHPIPKGGHVHCFTGSKPFALALLDLGFHIGFTGIITFKKVDDLREVVAAVPMERLLIETDSPYLAPGPKRGRRNEPAYVRYVAEEMARIKGVGLEEMVAQTTRNTFKLFGIDPQPVLSIEEGASS